MKGGGGRKEKKEGHHKNTKQLNRETSTGKMAQWVKKLAAKPNDRSSILGSHIRQERTNSQKLTYTHRAMYTVDDSIHEKPH